MEIMIQNQSKNNVSNLYDTITIANKIHMKIYDTIIIEQNGLCPGDCNMVS